MPKKRIFIAIQISEEVKNIAENYIEPFMGDKNIRIPKKQGWHITVVFCGYLDENELGKLKEILNGIVSETNSFEISPDKIMFYPPRRPRMVWLAFKTSQQFTDLKNKIENVIVSYQKQGLFRNFRLENRESNPHLTLARFEEKYFNNIKNFLPAEGIDLKNETSPFLVNSIDIIESHLSRTGAEYELLDKINLL